MRTTIRIDDDLLRELKKRAAKENTPLTQLVNETLRSGLEVKPAPRPPYQERVFSMGAPLIDIDKALSIAAEDEDLEVLHKLELRK